jgi:hypothetical protein
MVTGCFDRDPDKEIEAGGREEGRGREGEEITGQQAPLSIANLPTVIGVPAPLQTLVPNSGTTVCTDPSSPACCQNCVSSERHHLAGNAASKTSLGAWASSVTKLGNTPDLYNALAGTGGVISHANNHLNNPAGTKGDNTSQFIHQVADLLSVGTLIFGGNVTKTIEPAQTWVLSFPEQYGRFLKRSVVNTVGCTSCSSTIKNFAEPAFFEDQQFRGAQSYCAMNRAAQQLSTANAYSMADSSAGSWWLFSIGQVAPRVKLLSPIAVTSPNGAEAFAMPISLGGHLNPLKGPIFPTMPELAHPLVWVTGDSEVLSQEDYGTAYRYTCSLTQGCSVKPYDTYRKNFRNMQHVDALAGRSSKASVALSNVLLASFAGFINVTGGGGISIEQGQLELANPLAQGRTVGHNFGLPNATPRSAALDLGLSVFASDAPLAYCDGGYCPDQNGVLRNSWASWLIGNRPALRDDDRAISVRDTISEHLSVTANAHLDVGAISVDVAATASLVAQSSQKMVFREHTSLVRADLVIPGSPHPTIGQSNVVIVPEMSSSMNVEPLHVTASMLVSIPFFGPLQFSFTVFKADPFSLASLPPTIASEAHRLRVGEYSLLTSAHDGLNDGPPSYSHLPNSSAGLSDPSASGAQFASFPPGTTVASCLGSPSFNDSNVPGPAAGAPAAPPPNYQMCYEGFATPRTLRVASSGGASTATLPAMPANVCSNIAGYVGSISNTCGVACDLSAQQQCINDMLTFLCGGTSQTQPWGTATASFNVVSRVRDPNNPAATDQIFSNILTSCTDAFAGTASQAQSFLEGFTKMHACTTNGTLIGQKVD